MNRQNNFNLIRLCAAYMVLVGHSFYMLGYKNEPFGRTMHFIDIGGFAVKTFFVISGYLLARSLANNQNLFAYFASRFIRILPAYIVMTLFTVFVVGACATTDPQYWHQKETWDYLNSINLFKYRALLPGVFKDQPDPVVNGSLWTLPFEVACYVMLAALAGAMKSFRFAVLAAYIVAFTVIIKGLAYPTPVFASLNWFNLSELSVYFMGGAVVALFPVPRNSIIDLLMIGSVALGELYGVHRGDWAPFWIPFSIALPYLVVRLALLPQHPFIKIFGKLDISYGVYLYACPIQQLVIHWLGNTATPLKVIALATLITLPLGYMSWRFVESPLLAWKTYMKRAGLGDPSEQGSLSIGSKKLNSDCPVG